jgi:hypothetical protein
MMPYYQPGYPAPDPAPQAAAGQGRPAPSSISIWAGDLDSYMDETFLRNAVAACGWANDITRIKVVRDRYNGMHAGYGFLDAASPDAAARVLATGSGMPIPGTNRCWRLNLGRNAQGGQGQGGGVGPAGGAETNVYVGDLEPSVSDFELMSAFRPRFPSTRHAKVVCNDFGQSRGFGFVRFANAMEAERAVQEMNGFEFHGKPIRLSPANGRPKGGGQGGQGGRGFQGPNGGIQHLGGQGLAPGGGGFGGHDPHHTSKRPRQTMAPDDPNNTTLFIGGTGTHVTEDILWREFAIFGELEAVRVPVNKTGFAFVRFKTREAAQRAKDDISGTHFISLNTHKPVRLEWASEQLAITSPPPAAAAAAAAATAVAAAAAAAHAQVQAHAHAQHAQVGAQAFGVSPYVPGYPAAPVDPSTAAAQMAAAVQAAGGPGATGSPAGEAVVDGGTPMLVEGGGDGGGGKRNGEGDFAGNGVAESGVSSVPFPWLNSGSGHPSGSP